MNLEMVISIEELSQILAGAGISHSHKEYILAVAKNLSTSLEILEGPKFPELQKDFSYQSMKEAEKLGTTSNGEQSLRSEIEEFSTCISTYPSGTKEINHSKEEDMCKDYIENWFQEVITPQSHFLLRHFLLPNQTSWLVPHIQVSIEVNFSYLDIGMFLTLLRTWLHWKNSYT